jgi:hypothetical protein
MDFVTPFVLAGAITVADYRSTSAGLSRGAIEANPLAGHSRSQAAIAECLGVVAVDLGVQKLAGRRKWIVWAARGLLVGGAVALVRHNNGVLDRDPRMVVNQHP